MADTQEFSEESSFQPNFSYSADALSIKLDPSNLIDKIESFLRGKRLTINENNKIVSKSMGEPLANERGIQKIMQLLSMIVSKDTVMGNLEDWEVNQIVFDVKKTLAQYLAVYCEEWGVSRSDRGYIVNSIEYFVKIFLSRTKNDGERSNLGMRVQHSSSQVERERSGFSLNPFRSKNR